MTLKCSISPTRRDNSLIPVAMESYDKIEWIKSWHMLVVLHLVAENQFEIGLFQKMRFGAHSSDPLVSGIQGSGMCHILNGSYVS